MNSGLQLAQVVVFTSGAGLLMLYAGAAKRRLRWKPEPRRCATCGRRLRDCRCHRR
jgi:hypothetical protein